MQDEVLLRAWNAHRDYIAAIRAGGGPDRAPRRAAASPLAGELARWFDAIARRLRHAG